MTKRVLAGVVAIGGLFLFFALRQHIRVLSDIIYTYSTFYTLLRKHPNLLYKYPGPIPGTEEIPRIIHQVGLGNVNIEKYQNGMNSCRALHPDWQFNLWTDKNGTDFLAKYYPDILPHYLGYHQDIQRANILRYAALHKYGGAYFDLDMTCLVSLDKTPLVGLPFVTPGARPAGVNNAFILARPGHALLSHILSAVPMHDLHWGLPMRLPYTENMLSTGCMFFSNIWIKYAEDFIARRQKDSVYILADGNGDMAPHMWRGRVKSPIMAHSGDSSWHSWDAGVMLTMGKYYALVVSVLAIGALGVVFFLSVCCCSRRHRRTWRKKTGVSTFGW